MRQIFKIFLVLSFLLLNMPKAYSQVKTEFQRGNQPSDIVITPDGSRIYVTAMGTHNVFVIDTQTNLITEVIDLCENGFYGAWPFREAITPDGSTIYVANMMSDNISVIDTDSNRVVATIEMGHFVHDIAITPDGKFAYVDLGWDRVAVIDVSTNTVTKTIPLNIGDQSYTLAASHDGSTVYVVSQAGGGRVYVIDVNTNTITDQFEIGKEVTNQGIITVSPDDSELYLPCGITGTSYERPTEGVNKIFVIDLANRCVTAEIEVIGGPIVMRLSSNGQTGYVSTFAAQKVFVVDLSNNTVIAEIDWDGVSAGRNDLRDMVITPEGSQLYITGWDADAIFVADLVTNRMTNVINLNEITTQLYEIAITPDGKRVYVSNESKTPGVKTGLFVIDTDTNTVIDEIAKVSYPHCPTITSDGKLLYAVVESWPKRVIVIDVAENEIVNQIFLSDSCQYGYDIAIIPGQNKAYVTDARLRYVYVADLVSSTVVKRIDVGWWPQMVVVTPDGSRAYVSRQNNPHDIGGLVIIDTATDQVIGTIAPPSGTTGTNGRHDLLAVSPDGLYIYWETSPDRVNIVDIASNQVVKSINLGTNRDCWATRGIHPSDIAFTTDGSRAYIPCGDAFYVIVWDVAARAIIDRIVDVGIEPVAIVITPDNKLAYVTNKESEDVSVIDLGSNTVIARISIHEKVLSAVDDGSIVSFPRRYWLSQNFPNPFNPTTIIRFQLPKYNKVSIKIYDLLGREVRMLVDKDFEPGSHTITWDGSNNSGIQVTSGIYFYRMETEEFVRVRKALFLK